MKECTYFRFSKKTRPLLQGRVARGTNPFHAAMDIHVPKPRLECL